MTRPHEKTPCKLLACQASGGTGSATVEAGTNVANAPNAQFSHTSQTWQVTVQSRDAQTAMEESLAHFRYYGIPFHAAMPRVFVAIKAQLSKVLDLTEGVNRQRLQIAESRLLGCDWRKDMAGGSDALSQRVGRAAKAAGVEAVVVRSAEYKNGRNLVVFPENLRKSSQLTILDPGKLSPST